MLPPSCTLLGRRADHLRGRLACEAEFPEPVDWAAVLDSLEVHRVWTLPHGSEVPREHMVMDGVGISVEARRGGCYRLYRYGNPETETRSEYRDAAALMRTLTDLRERWSPR